MDPHITSDNIPNLSNMKRIKLEPGTGYRFRLSAINGCGRGDYSEVSFFFLVFFPLTNKF